MNGLVHGVTFTATIIVYCRKALEFLQGLTPESFSRCVKKTIFNIVKSKHVDQLDNVDKNFFDLVVTGNDGKPYQFSQLKRGKAT